MRDGNLPHLGGYPISIEGYKGEQKRGGLAANQVSNYLTILLLRVIPLLSKALGVLSSFGPNVPSDTFTLSSPSNNPSRIADRDLKKRKGAQ